MTAGLATLFFITSMVMAYFASQREDGNVVLDALQQSQGQEVPVQQEAQTDLPPMPAAESDVPAAAPSDLPVPAPASTEGGAPSDQAMDAEAMPAAEESGLEAAPEPDASKE